MQEDWASMELPPWHVRWLDYVPKRISRQRCPLHDGSSFQHTREFTGILLLHAGMSFIPKNSRRWDGTASKLWQLGTIQNNIRRTNCTGISSRTTSAKRTARKIRMETLSSNGNIPLSAPQPFQAKKNIKGFSFNHRRTIGTAQFTSVWLPNAFPVAVQLKISMKPRWHLTDRSSLLSYGPVVSVTNKKPSMIFS